MATQQAMQESAVHGDILEWTRRPTEMAMKSACAFYRAVEAMRTVQLHAAHVARQLHENAEATLAHKLDGSEVTALQNKILREDVEESTRYWQGLFEATVRMQSEMLEALQTQWVANDSDMALPMPSEGFGDWWRGTLLEPWFHANDNNSPEEEAGAKPRIAAQSPKRRARRSTSRARS